MDIFSNIRSLRIIAFFLFFTPALALIGSLVAHNTLISFPFSHELNFNFVKNLPGETSLKYECNEDNDYCYKIYNKTDKLNKCNKYYVDSFTSNEAGEIYDTNNELNLDFKKTSKELNEKIFLQWKISDRLNEFCIINSNLIKLYDFAPIIFEKIYELKISKKTSFGTSTTVNPILYGETSISNIVKRFPIKMIFKPLMYLSVILMIFYWYYNNLVFNKLQNIKINNKFFIFGVLSGIFLLLHVIFLGWTFESKFLTTCRRSLIVFFIFFEVLAQAYLIKDILKKKSEISRYLNTTIMYCKLVFVFFVCTSTLIIFLTLLMVNLNHKVDYILEWNYFLILLFFYFLSSIMWKKN